MPEPVREDVLTRARTAPTGRVPASEPRSRVTAELLILRIQPITAPSSAPMEDRTRDLPTHPHRHERMLRRAFFMVIAFRLGTTGVLPRLNGL